MNNSIPSSEVRAHEYRLFVREGALRFYFKNKNEGVWLSERGIGWHIGGVSCTREWSAVTKVHLEVNFIPRQGAFGTCRLIFSDGTVLNVLSVSQWGGPDADRNVEYGRFLTELHRMIPQAVRGKIFFQSGASQTRHTILIIAAIVAAIFFGLLPLGILIYFRSLEALFIFGAGAAFVWPLLRMIKTAEPGSYDPDAIPEHLFP
jgi:hypothetical protein